MCCSSLSSCCCFVVFLSNLFCLIAVFRSSVWFFLVPDFPDPFFLGQFFVVLFILLVYALGCFIYCLFSLFFSLDILFPRLKLVYCLLILSFVYIDSSSFRAIVWVFLTLFLLLIFSGAQCCRSVTARSCPHGEL